MRRTSRYLRIFIFSNIVNNVLADDGILILEPWYSKSNWKPSNHLVVNEVNNDYFVRMSHGQSDGSIIFHHLVATEDGISHIEGNSKFWLHDTVSITSSLESLGMATEFVRPTNEFKRGLFLSR